MLIVLVMVVKTKTTMTIMISMAYEIWMMKMTNVYYISPPPQNLNQIPLHHLNENSILQKFKYICVCVHVCVTLLTSSSILFQPFNRLQSCPTKRNTRKSHLYYFICPVTSLLHTALRLQYSRMLHHVVGRWVPSTRLTLSLPQTEAAGFCTHGTYMPKY